MGGALVVGFRLVFGFSSGSWRRTTAFSVVPSISTLAAASVVRTVGTLKSLSKSVTPNNS